MEKNRNLSWSASSVVKLKTEKAVCLAGGPSCEELRDNGGGWRDGTWARSAHPSAS